MRTSRCSAPDDLDLRPENLEPILPLAKAKEEFQKRYIHEVLERNNGNRTKTARDLGVDPRTIFRHLEKLEAEKTGGPLPPGPRTRSCCRPRDTPVVVSPPRAPRRADNPST